MSLALNKTMIKAAYNPHVRCQLLTEIFQSRGLKNTGNDIFRKVIFQIIMKRSRKLLLPSFIAHHRHASQTSNLNCGSGTPPADHRPQGLGIWMLAAVYLSVEMASTRALCQTVPLALAPVPNGRVLPAPAGLTCHIIISLIRHRTSTVGSSMA